MRLPLFLSLYIAYFTVVLCTLIAAFLHLRFYILNKIILTCLFIFWIIAPYKYSYLITYLLTKIYSSRHSRQTRPGNLHILVFI